MTDSKMAIKIIDSSDDVIPYKVIREMIEWDDENDSADTTVDQFAGVVSIEGDDFIFHSEKKLAWVDKQRANFKRAIRSRLRDGRFALQYRPEGDRHWYDSITDFRGDSPAPQFMSYQVGIVRRDQV